MAHASAKGKKTPLFIIKGLPQALPTHHGHYLYPKVESQQKSIRDIRDIKISPKECFPGLVNFVIAVAYHSCLNLPRAFSQPGKYSFGDPCNILPNTNILYIASDIRYLLQGDCTGESIRHHI